MASENQKYKDLKPLDFRQGFQPSEELGGVSYLTQLPLDRLVIDERYQRKISLKGKSNIKMMIENFDWRKFIPVVVTKVEGGFYAIIDGQHRATAALMHPDIDLVPCMIIEASMSEAADCFKAINGNVMKVTLPEIFKARLAAGDPDALEIAAIMDGSGVTLLTSRSGGKDGYQVGETFAIGAIEFVYKAYGSDMLATTLQSIVDSGDGNVGNLRGLIIKSVAEALSANKLAYNSGGRLMEVMDMIDLDEAAFEARASVRRWGGSTANYLVKALLDHFEKSFSLVAAE